MDLPSTWTTTQHENYNRAFEYFAEIKKERRAGTLTEEKKQELEEDIRGCICTVRSETAQKHATSLKDVEKWKKLIEADTLVIERIKLVKYDDILMLGDIQNIHDIREKSRNALLRLKSLRDELAFDNKLTRICP